MRCLTVFCSTGVSEASCFFCILMSAEAKLGFAMVSLFGFSLALVDERNQTACGVDNIERGVFKILSDRVEVRKKVENTIRGHVFFRVKVQIGDLLCTLSMTSWSLTCRQSFLYVEFQRVSASSLHTNGCICATGPRGSVKRACSSAFILCKSLQYAPKELSPELSCSVDYSSPSKTV